MILAEVDGGFALILGLCTRSIALILFIETLLGVITFHLPHGRVFTTKDGAWEYPAIWAVALLALALLGDDSASNAGCLRARPAGSTG